MKRSIEGCPGEYENTTIIHPLRAQGRVVVIDHVANACGSVPSDAATLTIRLPGTGDGDADGDVDLDDFADMVVCYGGPDNGPISGSCPSFDLDCDDDVDLVDFGGFQVAFTGSP